MRSLFVLLINIITVSNEIKEIVKDNFRIRDKKITVLKNGLILDEHKCINQYNENDLFPHKCGLKILAVGRLTYQKAMEVLVKGN